MNKPLNEYRSSTGGTVQVFTWGLRHISGRVVADDNDDDEKTAEVTQPRKRGRPRKNP